MCIYIYTYIYTVHIRYIGCLSPRLPPKPSEIILFANPNTAQNTRNLGKVATFSTHLIYRGSESMNHSFPIPESIHVFGDSKIPSVCGALSRAAVKFRSSSTCHFGAKSLWGNCGSHGSSFLLPMKSEVHNMFYIRICMFHEIFWGGTQFLGWFQSCFTMFHLYIFGFLNFSCSPKLQIPQPPRFLVHQLAVFPCSFPKESNMWRCEVYRCTPSLKLTGT